jgi:hypothetical protein
MTEHDTEPAAPKRLQPRYVFIAILIVVGTAIAVSAAVMKQREARDAKARAALKDVPGFGGFGGGPGHHPLFWKLPRSITDRWRTYRGYQGPYLTFYNDATADDRKHAKDMRHLCGVSISYTQIGDEGLEILSRMPRLRSIRIYEAPVTDKGIAYLSRLPNLTTLKVGGNRRSRSPRSRRWRQATRD